MKSQDIDKRIAHPKDIDSWIKWIEARGYDKELKCACGEDVPWLLSQLKAHREALKSLKREVRGTLYAHEMAIRYDYGNSNWNCLDTALEKADRVLIGSEEKK